tara:strand:- start:388 stop:744 length:357 start_codon:yes stop_codon:yes gene_type:complete
MSARIIPGRSWTNKIRLPEDVTNLDVSTPVGAAAVGATVRILKSARGMEDIANVLSVAGSITTTDTNAQGPTVIGVQEYTILTDGQGQDHKVSNPETIKTFMANGMKVKKVIEEEITA